MQGHTMDNMRSLIYLDSITNYAISIDILHLLYITIVLDSIYNNLDETHDDLKDEIGFFLYKFNDLLYHEYDIDYAEYENICKLYYNRDYCNDVFDKVLMLINNSFESYIKNIEEKDIDLRIIVFKQSTPNDVIIKLLEKMDNDEYINSKLGWSFEYDHKSGLYKLSLCVKEV